MISYSTINCVKKECSQDFLGGFIIKIRKEKKKKPNRIGGGGGGGAFIIKTRKPKKGRETGGGRMLVGGYGTIGITKRPAR
jgi:hypothetical protein